MAGGLPPVGLIGPRVRGLAGLRAHRRRADPPYTAPTNNKRGCHVDSADRSLDQSLARRRAVRRRRRRSRRAATAGIAGRRRRPPLPPLFFKEEWQQRRAPANAGPDFVPEGGVTPAAVTNTALELEALRSGRGEHSALSREPAAAVRSRAIGAGPRVSSSRATTRIRRRARVAAGTRTDPPNLWTGVCQHGRRRDAAPQDELCRPHGARTHPLGHAYVGLPRRPPDREARGRQLVRRRLRRRRAVGELHAVSRVGVRARIRCAGVPLDISRIVTTGQAWASPDLSRVDEVGFADLLPGSGHGMGRLRERRAHRDLRQTGSAGRMNIQLTPNEARVIGCLMEKVGHHAGPVPAVAERARQRMQPEVEPRARRCRSSKASSSAPSRISSQSNS